MVEDIIGQMREGIRARHTEQVEREFTILTRDLREFRGRMYTSHFVDLNELPEYATLVNAVDRLEKAVLDRYKP